ncbi:MAG: transcriptional regulator GcvA [Burkholderiaceae bacterium]
MRLLQSLPSLNALRAFEAVARLLSFAKAAEELHVTPGAVSHQIAALEALLGQQLFKRDARGVSLTAAAAASLPKLTQGFDTLREAIRLLQIRDVGGALEVAVAPAFATRWLLPRLPRFTAAHPEIELRVSTGLGLIDALRPTSTSNRDESSSHDPSADLAIRFGRGVYPGQRVEKLFTTIVTPVCSPRLMRGPRPLREPADLRHHLLLHDDTIYFDEDRPDWNVWLEAAHATAVDGTRGPHFSHTGLALDAAVDGLGVALAVGLLTADDLASGRLVAPFPIALPSHHSYHLVCPETNAERPELTAFAQWLREEAVPPLSAVVDK